MAEYKKRAGIRITYESLMSLLGLPDNKMLRLVNRESGQDSEYFDIIISGPGCYKTPEGNSTMYADAETIRMNAKGICM